MKTKNDIPVVYAKTRKEWRTWLSKNCQTAKAVLLLIYHKKSKTPSIYYPESIEESICFGWIDGKANKRDEESFYLSFTPRSPKSKWSKVNKERVANMTAAGLMTASGQALIDLAKSTGTWEALDDVDNTVIPDDLQEQFNKNKTAFKNFKAFAPSSQRLILEWILNAKKSETRLQRIMQTVEQATDNIKANHPGTNKAKASK